MPIQVKKTKRTITKFVRVWSSEMHSQPIRPSLQQHRGNKACSLTIFYCRQQPIINLTTTAFLQRTIELSTDAILAFRLRTVGLLVCNCAHITSCNYIQTNIHVCMRQNC